MAIRWAKGEAGRLLGAIGDRWRHVEAVARLATRRAALAASGWAAMAALVATAVRVKRGEGALARYRVGLP